MLHLHKHKSETQQREAAFKSQTHKKTEVDRINSLTWEVNYVPDKTSVGFYIHKENTFMGQ